LIVSLAVACGLPGAGAAAKEPQPSTQPTISPSRPPLHPPLKVLERFKITEYPIIAWCFHGKGQGYDEPYVRAAKGAGFNVLIESQEMLRPAKVVGGVKIMAVAFRFNTLRIERQTLNRFGADHPNLMGFVLDDNCRRISGNSKHVGTWMKKNHPHLIPYVSENHDTRNQIKTDIRILGTQNSRLKNGNVAGANGYCNRMETDRRVANMFGMSFWPLWYGMNANGSVRFQVFSAMAYGAQGVVCFAYTPIRGHWKPGGRTFKEHAHAAAYVHNVIGPHVLGTRSVGVLHAPGKAASNKWVARMDDGLIAGMLFTEKRLAAKDPAKVPNYVMVVRKEFGPNTQAKQMRVDFAPEIPVVEVLQRKTGTDADKIRVFEPAASVPLKLLTGDARLLVLNPDLTPLGDVAEPYLTLCKRMSALAADVRAGGAKDPAEKIAAIRKDVAALAAKATDAQTKDTLARLTAAVESLTKLQPKPKEEK